MFVRNMVKVYPTRLKIFEYRAGYHKKDEGSTPIDDWLEPHQYYQQIVRKSFAPEPDEIEYQSPDFVQVPMPHSSLYKLFLQAQDKRMGINSSNELQALLERSALLEKSIKRSKINIFDIIACNDFDMFITFSFGKDHFDIDKCKDRMKVWLDNQQKIHKRKGLDKFSYILIPEYHKDRKAIHFHGLFNNYQGSFVESRNPHTGRPVIQKGKKVYNLKSYTLGFSNMTYIVNKEATARYVTKYVSKDLIALPGQQRYWFSRGLNRPLKLYNEDLGDIQKELLYEGENYTISQSRDSLGSVID